MAFFNMVFDASSQAAAEAAASVSLSRDGSGKRMAGGSGIRVVVASVEPSNTQAPRVVCLECSSPARKITASPCAGGRGDERRFWLIEHTTGRVTVVADDGTVVRSEMFAGNVKCCWWIDCRTAGVVVASVDSKRSGCLSAFLIDAFTGLRGETELDSGLAAGGSQAPASQSRMANAGQMAVIAQGEHVVSCTAGSDGGVRFWHIKRDPNVGGAQNEVAATAGLFEAVKQSVVDLRWVGEGVGLAATRSGGYWINVHSGTATSFSSQSALPDMVSWRWQESVIAVAPPSKAEACAPRDPVLCLPSPTGMSFYLLENPKVELHSRTFPKGWVWLCGSVCGYAVLSPCRHKATICQMPSGDPLYTVETQGSEKQHGEAIIQDGWMLDGHGCAVSTGKDVFLVVDATKKQQPPGNVEQ
ncbi:hypothetical protein GQ54DRAFT_308566 [Martensiomyces pterosporus]|nr:hypothetical protein GQ54DRAFT_308566 [Martensiomyces pterosporus]